MWIGGVRVVILNENDEILMLRQEHDGRSIWMVPGGNIEGNENAREAAIREVREETGLNVEVDELVWHVEEVSPRRGQRFVNFFTAHIIGGELSLGTDPERSENSQVMREIKFMTKKEISEIRVLYPEYLKDEIWNCLLEKKSNHKCFKEREERK